MKKILALLLVLILIGATSLGLAESVKLTENASGFDLTLDLPDGATVRVENNGDVPYTFITFADDTLPLIYISVAPTEEYEGETIGSLDQADLDTLYSVISADFDMPSYQLKTTAGGYEYMLVEDDSETDSALMVMLYEGYFVQMSVWNVNYDTLTAEDMTAAEGLLDTLSVVDVS